MFKLSGLTAAILAVLATLSFSSALAQTTAPSPAPARAPQSRGQEKQLPKAMPGPEGARRPAPRTAAVPGNKPQLIEKENAGRAATPPPPKAPQPPFQLTPNEQKIVEGVLKRWEETNSKVTTFKCEFVRREYDDSLAPTDPEYKKNGNMRSKALGVIKYKRPDQGMFQVQKSSEYNTNTSKYDDVKNHLEHWVCDGKAIYQFDPAAKELVVHAIPEEMRGNAIADGPVPFIFGASADKLKQRYWIREKTPKELIGKFTWLEIYPKFAHDAANFEMAVLTLDDAKFTISAVMTVTPGSMQKTTYMFSDIVINDPLSRLKGDFTAPSKPLGWKRVDFPSSTPPEKAAADKGAPNQPEAKRTKPAPQRR